MWLASVARQYSLPVWIASLDRQCTSPVWLPVWLATVDHPCGLPVWLTSVAFQYVSRGSTLCQVSLARKCGSPVACVARQCGLPVWLAKTIYLKKFHEIYFIYLFITSTRWIRFRRIRGTPPSPSPRNNVTVASSVGLLAVLASWRSAASPCVSASHPFCFRACSSSTLSSNFFVILFQNVTRVCHLSHPVFQSSSFVFSPHAHFEMFFHTTVAASACHIISVTK